MINLFSPALGQAELLTVADSFNTGWVGKGPKVAEFERAWARHIGVSPENVASTNSCTEALFTAVKLLGIGPGDEVIIPTIHFIGAAQAVLAAGARPVFCDVGSRTLNTTAEFISSKFTIKTKAVILNHYGGVPCNDLKEIAERCYNREIYLIEDAANAPASVYNGQAVGTFGDIGCWSFDSMKIITTGDGGMMYIRGSELANRARKLLYLGTNVQSGSTNDNPRWWEFEVDELGARRSVMNDVAAGMGVEQLKRLPEFVIKRKYIEAEYDRVLPGLVTIPPFGEMHYSQSAYFYWIQTPRRDELAKFLRANGVYTSFRYWPLHRALKTGDSLPNAEWAADNTLLLPLHCNLSDADVEYICEKVKEFFRG